MVERLSRRYRFDKELQIYRIRKAWVELFGRYSKHVMPEEYKRRTLYIHTESPTWKTELTYLREEIAKNLSSRLNIPIKRVVIKIAPYRPWEDEPGG